MEEVFDILRRNNIISRKAIKISAIDSLSSAQIIELRQKIANASEIEEPNVAHNTFTHSASTSLSGGRRICSALSCRLRRVEELGRFALLYSDRVYIENPFSQSNHITLFGDETELKIALFEDLHVLLTLKPLLQKKYIVFFTPKEHYCSDCLNEVFGRDTKKRVQAGYKQLSKEYLSVVKALLVHMDDQLCRVECSGPELYLEHETVLTFNSQQRNVNRIRTSKPRLMKRLERDGALLLSRDITKNLNINSFFARTVADSVSYGMMTAKILNASLLTDQPLDITFLNQVSEDSLIEKRNQIALKHLTSAVPFVEDVKLSDLIKIREREEEAFIRYRHALGMAIDEFKMSGSRFTERDARALYSDVISPQLAALDQSVKQAKRDLVTKAYRSVIAVAGTIAFGIYAGFIPTEMVEMAKVLGFTKVATDILEKLLPLGDAANSAKSDDLYFLWRVRKVSRWKTVS